MSNIMHTKAGFRALRELCGLSQKIFADQLGKNVDTIKKWESEKYTQNIPQAAWDYLETTWAEMQDAADRAVAGILENLKSGRITTPVSLPYWRSQAQYDAGNKRFFDDFGSTDALIRLIALQLDERGIDVEIQYLA